jgi:hypothetical protein
MGILIPKESNRAKKSIVCTGKSWGISLVDESILQDPIQKKMGR